jgi:hypothetical protein
VTWPLSWYHTWPISSTACPHLVVPLLDQHLAPFLIQLLPRKKLQSPQSTRCGPLLNAISTTPSQNHLEQRAPPLTATDLPQTQQTVSHPAALDQEPPTLIATESPLSAKPKKDPTPTSTRCGPLLMLYLLSPARTTLIKEPHP